MIFKPTRKTLLLLLCALKTRRELQLVALHKAVYSSLVNASRVSFSWAFTHTQFYCLKGIISIYHIYWLWAQHWHIITSKVDTANLRAKSNYNFSPYLHIRLLQDNIIIHLSYFWRTSKYNSKMLFLFSSIFLCLCPLNQACESSDPQTTQGSCRLGSKTLTEFTFWTSLKPKRAVDSDKELS